MDNNKSAKSKVLIVRHSLFCLPSDSLNQKSPPDLIILILCLHWIVFQISNVKQLKKNNKYINFKYFPNQISTFYNNTFVSFMLNVNLALNRWTSISLGDLSWEPFHFTRFVCRSLFNSVISITHSLIAAYLI